MIRRPPRTTLFPSTPLFRSRQAGCDERGQSRGRAGQHLDFEAARDARTDERVAGIRHERSARVRDRSEEHTSELQSRQYLVCRLLLEKTKHAKLSFALPLLT